MVRHQDKPDVDLMTEMAEKSDCYFKHNVVFRGIFINNGKQAALDRSLMYIALGKVVLSGWVSVAIRTFLKGGIKFEAWL